MRKHALVGGGSVVALAFVALVLRESGANREVAGRIHAPMTHAREREATALDARGAPGIVARLALSPEAAPTKTAPEATPRLDAAPDSVTVSEGTHAHVEPAVTGSGTRASDPGELSRLRRGLSSPDAKTRLETLRAVRDRHSRDLEADVALLVKTETFAPARRVAVQILAQGDVTANESILRGLKTDPDPVVELNASFGLARGGDEAEQLCLLAFCETARGVAPDLVPIIATALEDPALRSPAVIARFQQVADDPSVAPEARERAQQVIKAKRGSWTP